MSVDKISTDQSVISESSRLVKGSMMIDLENGL